MAKPYAVYKGVKTGGRRYKETQTNSKVKGGITCDDALTLREKLTKENRKSNVVYFVSTDDKSFDKKLNWGNR